MDKADMKAAYSPHILLGLTLHISYLREFHFQHY